MSTSSLKFKAIMRRPNIVWGASLGVAGLLYLKVWLPVVKISVPCVFHLATGLLCPGCGITRATLALLELEFFQAFRFNPLIFTLIPLYVIYHMAKKSKYKRTSQGLMASMLILTLTFGVLRNIPMFDVLAPTVIR